MRNVGYYYCSLDVFLNIIKNKELFLSDPLKMNDSAEILWMLERIKEDSPNTYRSMFVDYLTDESSGETIKITATKKNDEMPAEDLINIIKRYGQRTLYLVCFSKKLDLLSQWRAYGNDGKGVAIGFDLKMLEKTNPFCSIHNILYRKYCDESAKMVFDELKLEAISDSDIGGIDTDTKIKVVVSKLLPLLATYKNPAFREEQEVRLIYNEDVEDLYTGKDDKLEHDFRLVGDNDITEFVHLKFKPTAIKQICIGPKCNMSDEDFKAITSFYLEDIPDIVRSKATYR